jgi:nitrous oxidase accessory protein
MWLKIVNWVTGIFTDACENVRLMPWKQIWAQKATFVALFSAFLVAIFLVLALRNKLAKSRTALHAISYGALLISFLFVGLFLKAQPTTTNIVIVLNGIMEGSLPVALFIMEPFIFLSFLFIGITALLWGRGAFCGWLCPYGAMVELMSKVYSRLLPRFRWELPDRIHGRMLYLKYVLLAVIVGASCLSFMLSEYITEVEPFKTFVLKMNRPWYFVLYFGVITVGSLVVYRAYCRYVCPLGAALSVPSIFKGIPLLKLKRHDLCATCTVCSRGCEYRAIERGGRVSDRECLLCLDCQINYWDEKRCPSQVMKRRKKAMEPPSASAGEGSGQRSMTPVIFLAIIMTLFFRSEAVAARTLSVGPEMAAHTIAGALKKAKNGDVIEVSAGEYREHLRVDKAVRLTGMNNPVIIGSGGVFIEIVARGVQVDGFTLKDESTVHDVSSAGIYIAKGADGAIVRNNHIENAMHAIWSVSARGITVEHNTIVGKKNLERNYRGNGVYLTDSQEATIRGNTMDFCRDGIYLEVSHDGKVIGNEMRNSRYGIHTMWADRTVFSGNKSIGNLVGIAVMYSKQSEVTDNVVAGNQTHGLLLNQTTRSRIEGNISVGNTKGVFYYNSVFNTLVSNLIMNNSLGLHNTGGSWDNTVERNSFINNEVQVKFIAGRNQEWNGNYWSDYLGWDMMGKGSGEIPYETNSVVDHILWRYPAAKLLYASPSLQALWMLEKQFPILKVPRVVDNKPAMRPLHKDWKEVLANYPFTPERYYGDIDKLAIAH